MSDIDAFAALQDPVRRRLYDHVVAQDREVSRNEAAEAVGVQRGLAAFHLDKLVQVGLLEATSRRITGRSGPGAGRPAKLYRRAPGEHRMSLPPRDYRTAALLLAEAAEAAGLDLPVRELARDHGRALGAAAADGRAEAPAPAEPGRSASMAEVLAALRARGYEPRWDETGAEQALRLRNCPFDALAGEFPPLVCGMNLALLEGVLEGLGTGDLTARLDPRPGWCCVAISKNNEH